MSKLSSALFLQAVVLSYLVISGTARADRWVSPVGSATSSCSISSPCSSVSRAIDLASAAEVIYIEPGQYNEHDIWVDKDVYLVGTGPQVVLDAQHAGYVFNARQEVNLDIENVTLSNGETCIWLSSDATLILNRAVITGCGGNTVSVIQSRGNNRITIYDSYIGSNGGPSHPSVYAIDLYGGSTLMVQNSTLFNNHVHSSSPLIAGNNAAQIHLEDSRFSDNHGRAIVEAGIPTKSVYIKGCVFEHNTDVVISTFQTMVWVLDSEFINNPVGLDMTIGQLQLSRTQFVANGRPIFLRSVSPAGLSNLRLVDNGYVHLSDGDSVLDFVENHQSRSHGFVVSGDSHFNSVVISDAAEDGLQIHSGRTFLNNVTIARSGQYGISGASDYVTMTHSVVAYSGDSDCDLGIPYSAGYNLDSDGSCELSGNGDLSAIDPVLSSGLRPLPDPSSPVIDAGDDCLRSALPGGSRLLFWDARGEPYPRKFDGDGDGVATCDLGGYELRTSGECGDGFVDPGEECDDGNNKDGDGCTASCDLECGDGVVDVYIEQCDDGNRVDGDGCSALCMWERPDTCGDGELQSGEQCEPPGAVTNKTSDGIPCECDWTCHCVPQIQ